MKYYGQWKPQVDRVLHENFFQNVKGGFFVEAGAFDGIELSCCKFFEDTLGWKGMNFEPARKQFKQLCKNRPNCININAGLGSKEGTMTFSDVVTKSAAGTGNGSFKHSNEHIKELKNYGVTFDKYEAKIVTYKDMISKHDIKRVDLMTLDVEGFEFEAIKGMQGSVMPKIMCVEYSYIGLDKLIEFMKKSGYHYLFFSHNNAFFSIDKMNKDWFGKTNKEYSVVNGKISLKERRQ